MLQLWTELTEAATRAAKEKDQESIEVGTAIVLIRRTQATVLIPVCNLCAAI